MTKEGANPSSDIASKGVVARFATPTNLVVVAAGIAAFLWLFHQWFGFQNHFSWGSDDWSHAYVVPFISGYAIWRSRDQLKASIQEIFWPGILPLTLGVVCYLFFVVGFPNHMGQGLSIILTIFGLVLLNAGPKITALLSFPIVYLMFAVTISQSVMQGITFQLQLIASKGSWILLNVLQIQTDLAGNTLYISTSSGDTIPLSVAEACSGMRMVIAFYALGTAIAFLSTRYWWQRVALLLLAGPVAIFVNILRVASLGVLSLWNPEFAKGNAHMFVGVLWLIPSFALYMLCVWMLKKMIRDPEPAP